MTAVNFKQILSFLKIAIQPVRREFLFWLSTLFLLNFYSLVPSLVLSKMVDALADASRTTEQNYKLLLLLSAVLAGSWILISAFRLTVRGRITVLRASIGYHVRARTLDEVIFSENKERGGAGSVVQRVSSGVGDLYDFSRLLMNNLFPLITSLVGAFTIVLWVDVRLAPIYFFYGLGVALLLNYFSRRIQAVLVQMAKATEVASGALADTASKREVVTTEGAQSEITKHVNRHFDTVRQREIVYSELSIFQWRVFQTWNGLFNGAALLVGGWTVLRGNMPAGNLILFCGYAREITERCSDLLNNWEKFQVNIASLHRMALLFAGFEKRTSGERLLNHDWKELNAENVSFSYKLPNGEKVQALKNLTLKIGRGECVRLVGPSGSGKTTLAKVLTGYLVPDQGTIKVDGTDLSEFSDISQRSEFALALQEAQLLHLTLAENVTLLRELPEDHFNEIVDLCEVREIADRLPQGFDSFVGESAAQLSGGEKQRVALARALCRKASLIVLDESTTMLDTEREVRIIERIIERFPSVSLIIISHHERLKRLVEREFHFT